MKINEIITEVFNPETSFPIEWDDRHGPEEMHGRAYDRQGGFIDIKFIALRNDVVEVEFSRNDSYDMTGAGDANRVLATILEAFREYLRGYRPKIFVFSAKGGSRSRVYQSMIERFAAGAGYKQFDTAKLSDKARKQLGHSGSDVMVLRRAAVTEESFNGIDIDMDIEGDEIMVTAMGNGRELGHVLFVDEGEYLMPQDLEVDERFQGQGIAAAMYDYVKSKGYKIRRSGQQTDAGAGFWDKHRPEQNVWENFADGKVKGKSRPGRVKRAGASCNGSVTDLRARAKKASGEKAKMYHWCANMKSGRKKWH